MCVYVCVCVCVCVMCVCVCVCVCMCVSRDTVSRSGMFCVAMSTIECCKAEGVVDVFQVVKAQRLQKPGIVRTVVRLAISACHTALQVCHVLVSFHSSPGAVQVRLQVSGNLLGNFQQLLQFQMRHYSLLLYMMCVACACVITTIRLKSTFLLFFTPPNQTNNSSVQCLCLGGVRVPGWCACAWVVCVCLGRVRVHVPGWCAAYHNPFLDI